MSLIANRLAVVPSIAPSGFTCPDYDAQPPSKHCRSYLANGGCAREDHFMCDEWLKVNRPIKPILTEDTEPRRDLFGNLFPDKQPAAKTTEQAMLSREDIASFQALGIECCLRSEALGEVWLVPAYTEQPRRELRMDHAATLIALCSMFSGAKVTALNPCVTATSTLEAGQ